MNQKDILRMARKACILPSGEVYTEDIMDFARLIAEDCAKQCEALDYIDGSSTAKEFAEAIREAYKP
jgi:hypothetical protein